MTRPLARWCTALATAAAALACGAAQAEVALAGVFGEHMVLQRHQPIRLWGSARAGERIEVMLAGQQARTQADAHGAWAVQLAARPAGGPHGLRIRGDNELQLQDVLIGDVWLCAGQSNMAWPLARALDGAAEAARADHPAIRHFRVPQAISLTPQADLAPAAWQRSTPAQAGDFTAVGTFFARAVQRELGVPIGLINLAWGGTQIESWISIEAMAAHPVFAERMQRLPATPQEFLARRRAAALAQQRAWQPAAEASDADALSWRLPSHADASWRELQAPLVWERQGLAGFDGVVWYRRTIELTAEQATGAATLHLGRVDDCDETWVNGQRVGGLCGWDTPRQHAVPAGVLQPGRNVIAVRVTDSGGDGGFHGEAAAMKLVLGAGDVPLAGRWKARIEAPVERTALGPNDLPGTLYNTMVHPLRGLPVRGVLWYQGESNVTRAAEYATSFPLLIADWRRRWRQDRLPFYFVQLAAFQPRGAGDPGEPGVSDWAELREAQRLTLAVPHTGMAVATDIGDAHDIHPRNKQAVGARLARLALRHTYGRAVVASGPLYRSMRLRPGSVELNFSEHGGGLRARGNGGQLDGFEIADSRRRFQPASARIVGNRVRVGRPDMPHPLAVRYGWSDNPAQANLVNSADLPASPFRTDAWPLSTAGVRFELE